MSSYIDVIRVYETVYPRDQLYVMISEEFLENPQRETDSKTPSHTINLRLIPNITSIKELMKWLDLPSQRYFFPNITEVQPYDPLDQRTREDVWYTYYEKGVRRLEEYLGRDLPWTVLAQ